MHGVTAGYLIAGLLVTAVLFSMGWLVLPVIALSLLWHGLRTALVRTQPAHSHEAFLLRTYLLTALLLGLLYVVPGVWALRTLDPQSEFAAVLGTRDIETIAHWFRLWLADQLRTPGGGGLVAVATAGFFWFMAHTLVSVLIGIYLMVRVLRRFLRWSERRPA